MTVTTGINSFMDAVEVGQCIPADWFQGWNESSLDDQALASDVAQHIYEELLDPQDQKPNVLQYTKELMMMYPQLFCDLGNEGVLDLYREELLESIEEIDDLEYEKEIRDEVRVHQWGNFYQTEGLYDYRRHMWKITEFYPELTLWIAQITDSTGQII